MAKHHRHGIESTAAIGGHPLHPMLVPFPIAFLVGALATDIAYWATREPFWASASFWLLTAGLIMGAVAAIAGLIDFLTIEEARRVTITWAHFLGNGLALALAAVNIVVRWNDAANAVLPLGIILSAIVSLILLFTGWWGGELAYRYRIGAIDTTEGEARSAQDHLHNGRDRRPLMH